MITGLAAGGAERQVALLATNSTHTCEVVALSGGGLVARELQAAHVPVHVLGLPSNTDVRALEVLCELMTRGRYDLVHTHLFRATLFGAVAARLAGVPHVVTTDHSLSASNIERRRKSSWVRMLYLACARVSDVTIAVSRETQRQMLQWGVPASRTLVIPNGVDMNRFRYSGTLRLATRRQLAVPPGAQVICCVGRMEPTKRIPALLAALAPMLNPCRLLLVVGDGPDRAMVSGCARDLGVAGYVRLVGERGDVAAMLSAADLLVSASVEETFGLSVIEALASGLPVAYVSCPALDELADQGHPDAIRVDEDLALLPAAVLTLLTRYKERHASDPRLAVFGASHVSTLVDGVYSDLFSGRPLLQRGRQIQRPELDSREVRHVQLTVQQ